MTDKQKPLSERLGEFYYASEAKEEVQELEQRLAAAEAREDSLTQNWLRTQESLAAAEADQQRAVDAALEHVAGLFDRVGKRDEAAFLRSWRGTNPLAEATTKGPVPGGEGCKSPGECKKQGFCMDGWHCMYTVPEWQRLKMIDTEENPSGE